MSEQKQYYSFRDGLPTAPDVTAIQQRWPDLRVGDEIPYSEIAALLQIDIGSPRFKSVTHAWREREREQSRVIECVRSRAFVVASAEQVSSATHEVMRGIARKARRQRTKLVTVRTEDDSLRTVLLHHANLMHTIERESRRQRMNLIPASVATVPQMSPPKLTQEADHGQDR